MTPLGVEAGPLNFPTTFCCNCGDSNCMSEIQDTRITSSFFVTGADITFQLAIPVCSACTKSTRRRPPGLVAQFLTWTLIACLVFVALMALGRSVVLPAWAAEHLIAISFGIALLLRLLFDRMRRPRPPQTSFHQPVRVKQARLRFNGEGGQLALLKLGFTHPEYLNVFTTANRAAIDAGWLTAVKA
jgi:hypothetical protein